MAQVCYGALAYNLQISEALSFGALGTNSAAATGQINPTLAYVTGASGTSMGINLHFEKSANPVTLASSATVTYTLSSLTDDLGRNFSMAGGVTYLVIYITSRTAGDYLTLTPGATHGWTGALSGTTPSIKIFKLLLIACDLTDHFPIAAGSNDQITITNGGANSITFQIGLAGCAS
jgi:hypothetical protein